MTIEEILKKHTEQDDNNFKEIRDQHATDHNELKDLIGAINANVVELRRSVDSLGGLNDFIKGGKLMKSPLLLVVSFVVGLAVFLGALKSVWGIFMAFIDYR